ncbi:MAG: hypothetical protein LBK13_08815, partial [Spirochaetales bacterium]|nr:hypothetical protein [Spirochaetales bacterium]
IAIGNYARATQNYSRKLPTAISGNSSELPLAAGGDKDVHSALRAVHGGQPRKFSPEKLRPTGYGQVIACGNLAAYF